MIHPITYASSLDGARACPPEDSHGPPGFADLLRARENPNDKQYRELLEWIPRGFDPEKFARDKINKKLAVIARNMERERRTGARLSP